jgi:gas vesicle protein
MKTPSLLLIISLGLSLLSAGCSTVEYSIREKFGQHKREILVDRVQDAKESQEAAKTQFIDALTQFKSVTGFTGGKLEAKYDAVKKSYDACQARATDVSERIEAIEDVAGALFREWKSELAEYSSASLRQASERQLEQTRSAYEKLLVTMRHAESRMKPVLDTFKDQVLFLKHNLNAQAIASLGGVSAELQRDIDVLVRDMQRAIDDANKFITQMQAQGAGE